MKKLKECSIAIAEKEKLENQTFSHALFKPYDQSLIVVATHLGFYMRSSWLYQIALDKLPDFGTFELNWQKECRLPEADADTQVDSITLSKDGRQFAVTSCTSAGTSDGDWAWGCPEYISTFGDHFFECCYAEGISPPRHETNVAAFSPDGKQLVVSSNSDGYFYFIDCPATEISSTNDETFKREFIQNDVKFLSRLSNVCSLDWSPIGDLFAAGNSDGIIAFWNSSSKKIGSKKLFDSSVEYIKFSPDGRSIAFLSADGKVAII